MANKTYALTATTVQWNEMWGLFQVSLGGMPYAIALGGDKKGSSATPGALLQEVLDTLSAAKKTTWPIEPGKVQDFDLTATSKGEYVKIELTREAYVLISKALSINPNASSDYNNTGIPSIFVSSGTPVWETLPNDWSHFVRGYVDNVDKQAVDGDTIYDIRVVSVGDNVHNVGEGDTITVRFVGIDAPETKKNIDDDGYAANKNAKFASKYSITVDQAYSVAEEAKKMTRSILKNAKGSVIVDLDTKVDGSLVVDNYGRYIGMVYKLPVTFDQALPGNRVVNINKTLIANHSSISTSVPLAMPSVTDSETGTRFYDVQLWEYSIAAGADTAKSKIEEEAAAYQEQHEQLIADERARIQYNNEATVVTKVTHVVSNGETLEAIAKQYGTTVDKIISANAPMTEEEVRNAIKNPGTAIEVPVIESVSTSANPGIDFESKFTDGSDNTLGFFDPLDDRRDMETEFHLTIGDVQLVVPPLAIDVNRVSTLNKVKALRTKSSIMTKTSSSNIQITVQLYFHDLDSINGYKVKVGSHKEGFMMGSSYQYRTVDDYYYMDGLRSLIAQFKKAPFLPVRNEYLNDVWEIWNVALVNLTVASVPGFPHSLAATLTLAKFEHDAYMPQEVNLDELINYPMLRWYYQEVMNPKYKDNIYRTYLSPIEGELTNDFKFQIANEDQLKERQEAITELRYKDSPALYEDKLNQGDTELSKFLKDYQRVQAAIAQQKKYLSVRAEYESRNEKMPNFYIGVNEDLMTRIYGEEGFDADGMFRPYEFYPGSAVDTSRPKDGDYQIKVEAASNKNRINQKYNSGSGLYHFPATTDNEAVSVIIQNGEAIQFQKDTYAYTYSLLQQKAEESEGGLDLDDYRISDLWLTGIQVMYENTFAPIQLQMLDTPALQYLGSQDPYIQLTFETTERQAISDIRFLLEESERYSREYRYGISSGFIGFDNQLTKLFGVTTIMPETFRVSTVPGYVDRFQIQMTLCGFNKTQKRTESLNGFSSTYMDQTMADRKNSDSNNVVANDVVVLERKLKDLEVYPDLELPTYAELNEALGWINAGIPMYHNPDGAKFVDPDFYISTKWTFRTYIMEQRAQNQTMSLNDLAGLSGSTSSYSSDDDLTTDWTAVNYFTPDNASDFGYILDTIDSVTRSIITKDQGAGNEAAPNAQTTPNGVPQAVLNGQDYTSPSEIKKWASNAANVSAKPTFSQWVSWNNLGSAAMNETHLLTQYENYYKNLKNPSHLEVYLEIYKHIYALFVQNGFAVPHPDQDYPLNKAFDAGSNRGTKLTKGEYDDLTYARMQDFYKAGYMYLVETNPQFAKKKATMEPEGIKMKTYTKMANSIGNKGVPKITVERLANYIKALFHLKSGWAQYKEDGKGGMIPLREAGTNAVGIGKVRMLDLATSVDMAQRLMWDWRYNLEESIKYFFNEYTSALISSDINVRCRPWDWATRGYLTGSFTTYPSTDAGVAAMYKGRLDVPEYQKVILIFEGDVNTIDTSLRKGALYNHPDATFASPGNPVNSDIHSYLFRNSDKNGQQVLGGYDRMQFIGLPNGQVINVNQIMQNIEMPDGSNALEYTQRQQIAKSESGRILIAADDPRRLHRDMFTDMVEYDQRGRLLRAFPTFQMFIIDEGRWMTSYKLWDNLYGFNSIQSIDVYRSRKIAADTAVIKMTNVYSNLTSRNLDTDYGDWSYSFWDNLFWGKPSESILEARKELADTMMLKTGARLHLRVGYGSDVGKLPVLFNGTITEMDAQDVVTIIGQGDGIELSNIVSADPNETNDGGWFKPITEPRDLLCGLMTSRGNWFKNWINSITDGALWGDSHPLGIMHFGNPVKVPPALNPFNFYNSDYGEAAQNIYSSNGANTFSEWERQDGTPFGWTWGEAGNPLPVPEGDEKNIEIKLEGQTVWDIAQVMASCSPDYIAAVHPFEMRSTLFFGKPYYKIAYRYDSAYKWSDTDQNWQRTITSEIRKPYMQYHVFDSTTDIVSNQIKASEEGVYTNVIATYEGGISDLQMADWDIRFDKQKTATVQAPIVAQWLRDFWTSKDQANSFAQSTLRDYIKDMYKGQLVILGDPTIKPHDMCYMHDEMNTMEGPFQVKEVTHHFSFETGFITSVSPDAVVIVDDKVILSHSTWLASFGKSFAAYILGRKAAAAAVRRLIGSTAFLKGAKATKWSLRGLAKLTTYLPGGNESVKEYQLAVRNYVNFMQASDKGVATTLTKEVVTKDLDAAFTGLKKAAKDWEAKGIKRVGKMTTRSLLYTVDKIHDGIKIGKTSVEFLRMTSVVVRANIIGLIATAAISIVTETLAEMYRRKKKAMQAVVMVPLWYQGRQFTAGINGHKGMVIGDEPGKWDKFFMGVGPYAAVGQGLNWLLEDDIHGSVSFSTSYEDLYNGQFDKDGGLLE